MASGRLTPKKIVCTQTKCHALKAHNGGLRESQDLEARRPQGSSPAWWRPVCAAGVQSAPLPAGSASGHPHLQSSCSLFDLFPPVLGCGPEAHPPTPTGGQPSKTGPHSNITTLLALQSERIRKQASLLTQGAEVPGQDSACPTRPYLSLGLPLGCHELHLIPLLLGC